MLDETDIQRLLRLKRHELPPAGYHEKFLQDFHRRQRADLLRQPVWKIAVERMGAFFGEFTMVRGGYAAATAAVLLFAGVASFKMLNDNGVSPTQLGANHVSGSSPKIAENSPAPGGLNLDGHYVQATPSLPARDTTQISDPHYVIDTRPVSYERPFSF
jgi:hypothetical protein